MLFIGTMSICTLVSIPLSKTSSDNNPFAMPAYILAVALISRFTNGYFYGIMASVAGVICVNWIFTYPFWQFNMKLAGYPLTFGAMLIVSMIISAQTTRVKKQERLRYEIVGEQMRANLLRAIAHDIRTPLTSILGASAAIIENQRLPASDRDELLRGINSDARWLVRVTENLLSVTKFSSEDVKIKKTDEVVEEIVGSAIVKFRKTCADLPVLVAKPDEILLAPMDATLIEQVLINLFENTFMHGKCATRINVKISGEANRVCFEISDDGAGFPKHSLPGLLSGRPPVDEKHRADSKRSMGIGLTVCGSIIRAHGGEMTAGNNAEGGATVKFYLPCEEDDAHGGA